MLRTYIKVYFILLFSLESLTYRDLIDVLPYGNQADIIELKGVHLLEALEHSVSKYNPKAPGGEFLQVSGNYSFSRHIFFSKKRCDDSMPVLSC